MDAEPEVIKMLDLADKDFKAVILTMLMHLIK